MELLRPMASSIPIPNGAVGLKLLGDVCRRTLRIQKAALYYKLSLKVCSYIIIYNGHFISINTIQIIFLIMFSFPHYSNHMDTFQLHK
jgi:hypothetical protein